MRSESPSGLSPAKPNASACHTLPIAAMWSPAAVVCGQVVEVDPARQPQRVDRLLEHARAGEEARVNARRERAAVRGARLVELEVRHERAGCDLVGHEVVQHQHVRLLHHLGRPQALTARGANRPTTGRRGASSVDHERLEPEKACELLVEPGPLVVAVDEGIGELEPGSALPLVRDRSSVAARRRFQRAITFVNALSSTASWYSSGPITPSM